MNLGKLIGFFVFFISYNALCQKPGSQNDTEISWKSLTKENYSINYPENWDLDTLKLMGTKFLLLSPLDSNDDLFRENVNLITQDLTNYHLTLSQFTEISEKQINMLFNEAKIIESNRMHRDGLEFHKIIYSGKQGVYSLMFEQYYWVLDDVAYIITFTSEESKFNYYQSIGELVLNSFKLHVK